MTVTGNRKIANNIEDIKIIVNDLIDKHMAECDPHFFQYGEKDSRYLGMRDAAESMKDENNRHPELFVIYLMDEDSYYTKKKIKEYYKKMTKKAKEDYERAHVAFFKEVASEARNTLEFDAAGRLTAKGG